MRGGIQSVDRDFFIRGCEVKLNDTFLDKRGFERVMISECRTLSVATESLVTVYDDRWYAVAMDVPVIMMYNYSLYGQIGIVHCYSLYICI